MGEIEGFEQDLGYLAERTFVDFVEAFEYFVELLDPWIEKKLFYIFLLISEERTLSTKCCSNQWLIILIDRQPIKLSVTWSLELIQGNHKNSPSRG